MAKVLANKLWGTSARISQCFLTVVAVSFLINLDSHEVHKLLHPNEYPNWLWIKEIPNAVPLAPLMESAVRTF